MSNHIPRNNEVTQVTKFNGRSRVDIKPLVEAVFKDDEFLDNIEPHITNGGVEGHKLYDQLRILELAMLADRSDGIKTATLNTAEKVGQLMVVVRRHYVLDKKGKFVSVNPKRYALLTAVDSGEQTRAL